MKEIEFLTDLPGARQEAMADGVAEYAAQRGLSAAIRILEDAGSDINEDELAKTVESVTPSPETGTEYVDELISKLDGKFSAVAENLDTTALTSLLEELGVDFSKHKGKLLRLYVVRSGVGEIGVEYQTEESDGGVNIMFQLTVGGGSVNMHNTGAGLGSADIALVPGVGNALKTDFEKLP